MHCCPFIAKHCLWAIQPKQLVGAPQAPQAIATINPLTIAQGGQRVVAHHCLLSCFVKYFLFDPNCCVPGLWLFAMCLPCLWLATQVDSHMGRTQRRKAQQTAVAAITVVPAKLHMPTECNFAGVHTLTSLCRHAGKVARSFCFGATVIKLCIDQGSCWLHPTGLPAGVQIL